MKRFILLVLVITFANARAQRIDVGLGLGLANYWGDLAPSLVLSESKPAANIFARLNLSNTWALAAQYSYMQVSGSDNNFDFNANRNLNFKSTITEIAFITEYNFANFGYGVVDRKLTGYIFGGISGFKFNPQTTYAGSLVNLRDVKTEGVRYDLYSLAIPFGVGVKWIFARRFSLEANYNIRKTFTDYLDDVSATYIDLSAASIKSQQLADRGFEIAGNTPNIVGSKRGSDNYNDWFMTFTTTLSYRLPGRIKCPTFY